MGIMKTNKQNRKFGHKLVLAFGALIAGVPACSAAGDPGDVEVAAEAAPDVAALDQRLTSTYAELGAEGVAELAKADPEIHQLVAYLAQRGSYEDLQALGDGLRGGSLHFEALLSGQTQELAPEIRTSAEKLRRSMPLPADVGPGTSRPMVDPLTIAVGTALVVAVVGAASAGQNYACCASGCPSTCGDRGVSSCTSTLGTISLKEVSGPTCTCLCAGGERPPPNPGCTSGNSSIVAGDCPLPRETYTFAPYEYRNFISQQPTSSFITF
jgi:hypothetical protein